MHCQMRLPFILLFGLLHAATVLGEHAMTTVLARPLGGYGMTPLIFEPSISMLGLSSNSIETKVRKSPVFELLMPNYDDEPITFPVKSSDKSAKLTKRLDYGRDKAEKTVAAAPSTNSYYSAGGMLGLFGGNKGAYEEPIPSYKEHTMSRNDFSTKANSFRQSNEQMYGQQSHHQGPHSAAIQSVRSVEVKEVENQYENNEPQVIDIPPSALPIIINFRTSSSQIQIHQSHESAEPLPVQQTQSEDQPQYLKHSVTKPVIQEVHEIIMPYRKVIQEILPVEETVKTIVARGKAREGKGKGGGSKYSANAGYGGSSGSTGATDSKYKKAAKA